MLKMSMMQRLRGPSHENNQISGEELDDLLVPLFPKPGSNKRESEERVSLRVNVPKNQTTFKIRSKP